MAAKKKQSASRTSSAKKAATGKKASVSKGKKGGAGLKDAPKLRDEDCDLDRVCAYLAKLDQWLRNDFMPEFRRVRIAVCNVERQAFGTCGAPDPQKKLCKICEAADEPKDPVAPPQW